MKASIYQPSRNIGSKILRRFTPFMSRRTLKFDLDRPIVSFTFDDCPKSAIENGVKPLEAEGWLSTIYIAAGLFKTENHHGEMVSGQDVRALHVSGHEIGGHTFSHMDIQKHSVEDILKDIRKNDIELVSYGVPKPRTFAYPFGEVGPSLKQVLQTQYTGMRGIQPGAHFNSVDLNQIKSSPLFGDKDVEQVVRLIGSMKDKPGWLTIFTHDIRDNPSTWGCRPEHLTEIINAVKDAGADVMTVENAIKFLGGAS